jgi:hypothetical protein
VETHLYALDTQIGSSSPKTKTLINYLSLESKGRFKVT